MCRMTDRNSLPTHFSTQPAAHGFKCLRPDTWPSYFQQKLLHYITPIVPSLPSFLHRDPWSLSSLTDDSSSLCFPPVPTIMWHLHPQDTPVFHSHKTFHTQSLLFLFGFLFFPCWWLGWYLSTDPPPCCVATSLYHDIYCYSQFNRCLSFVSFVLFFIILGLLIWAHWGSLHHWWG